MLPVLLKLEFNTTWSQVLLVLVAVGVVVYSAIAGYRSAESRKQAPGRAALYAAVAMVLAYFGVKAALPVRMGGDGYGAPLHTYGMFIALGFLSGITLAAREALRSFPEKVKLGKETVEAGVLMRDHVLDLSFYILLFAMVGSRVLYIISQPQEYFFTPAGHLRNLWPILFGDAGAPGIFSVLRGGLVFYGGFLGSIITAWVYMKRHKLDFLRIADCMIPGVSIGAFFGRLGCFSAGCCWGDFASSKIPWAVRFPGASGTHTLFGGPANIASLAQSEMASNSYYTNMWVDLATGKTLDHAMPGVDTVVKVTDYAMQHGTSLPVHPTQLYESFAHLTMFLALILLRKYTKWFHGQILASWFLLYGTFRFLQEYVRGDIDRGGFWIFSTSQWVSMGMFALGASIFWRYGRRGEKQLSPAAA